MDLAGRNAIITGASQGFGYEVAKAYLDAGASIMICARNPEKLESARAALAEHAPDGAQVLAQVCDVSDEVQVSALIQAAISAFGKMHILVTNAGVYGPMGAIEDVDWDAWKKAIDINLYGTILPARALIPHFKANGYGKIVNLSGGGATSPLPNISAYAASKAAVVRMTETLAGELADHNITVNAVAPGALNTPLQDELLAAGPDVVGEKLYNKIKSVRQEDKGAPMDKGAALCVFLGSADSDGVTGRLISAIWDDWRDLPNHLDDLNGSDVYTLRRIIPMERGFEWGEVD
jgi:NAD(P)-dependent dehydrogenase (short-subunit alcohol dehydrogenase family)